MRLQKYLNEITKVSDEEINNILNIGFSRFKEYMKSTKFRLWPIALINFIMAFKNFGISFSTEGGLFSKLIGSSKEAMGTTFTGGTIHIYLSRKEIRSLKNLSSIKNIRKKVFDILVHEITHKKQFSAMSKEGLKGVREPMEYAKYIGSSIEIEAFARGAADELKVGRSEIVNTYIEYLRPNSEKKWRDFLKKTYQYIDLYGNDKAKENFRSQVEYLYKKIPLDLS